MSFIQSFRAARWLRTINLILQAVLFLTFFGGLNFLALHYTRGRFDLTRLRQHTLSPETVAYLQNLKRPVRVIVTLDDEADGGVYAPAYRDVKDILREYVHAAESNGANPLGRITVDFIKVDRRPAEARRYNLNPQAVLFLCGEGAEERRRDIPLADLYSVKNERRVAFLGEQAFTPAILDVSNPERKKIYFLTGHGEMAADNTSPARGLSDLTDALRQRNFAVESLDLTVRRVIPPDAAMILSVGPKSRYEPFEQELLRNYMKNQAGRLMLFLAPDLAPTGLEDLIFDWGLVADDVFIYESSADAKGPSGDLRLNRDGYTPHEITQALYNLNWPLSFGATRSFRPNPSRPTAPGLSAVALVKTSGTAWGEREYRKRNVPEFSPGDLLPPLSVVSVAELQAKKDNLPFTVPVGRLVGFGCADFIANNRLTERGNQALFFFALNWALGRDKQLSAPPRTIETFQLSLSREDLLRLRYSLLLGLPGVAAALGLLVYWTRRR